jgi:DNA polymerase IV
MERVILHCDLNSFYASVECLYNPSLRNVPMAVGGDIEKRHGIILAKNQPAKKYDIKTGEAIWQAMAKCPGLIVVPPRFSLYMRFSQKVRDIFARYTDRIESFGIDEAWLDVTGSVHLFGDGRKIADEIRQTIRQELGITASVGVSFNKVFAKLGSDYKKPDATTVITRENMKDIVFPLPVSDLLYVGYATTKKLNRYGIYTIGDLANADPAFLKRRLGKWGEYISIFANGEEHSPVLPQLYEPYVKSIGNSTTAPRDLTTWQDIGIITHVLAESVAARLRDHQFKCSTVTVYVRDNKLEHFTRQCKLEYPSDISSEIAQTAMRLFRENIDFSKPLRSIGIKASDLSVGNSAVQLSFFTDQALRERESAIDKAFDQVRQRFGFYRIQRGCMKSDTLLSGFNPKGEHVIFPEGYFKAGE